MRLVLGLHGVVGSSTVGRQYNVAVLTEQLVANTLKSKP